MEQNKESKGWRFFAGDRVLWIIAVVLAVFSVLIVYSSTAKMAYMPRASLTSGHYLYQQIIYLMIGFFVMFAAHLINSRFYYRFVKAGFFIALALTFLAYFAGATNGANRWLPVLGFRFQPSEMLKVATLVFLAKQLAVRQSVITELRIIPSLKFWTWGSDPEQRKIFFDGFFPILFPVGLACGVVIFAHTSSAILIGLISMIMMLVGRVRIKELLKLAGLGFVALFLMWCIGLGRSHTAGGRFDTWISIMTEPQTEKPIEHLTDVERSFIAIHNGGLSGKGAGKSEIRAEIIHPESDFAFAFFVEEYGLAMGVVILLLYLWIFFRAIEIFKRCGTAFPGLMVLGLAALVTCQALLHMMVALNISPETGQTLPLISRGGSSTIFVCLALGMILSVSRQNDERSHDQPKVESILD